MILWVLVYCFILLKSKFIKSNILKEKLLMNKVFVKFIDCVVCRCMIVKKSKFKFKINVYFNEIKIVFL